MLNVYGATRHDDPGVEVVESGKVEAKEIMLDGGVAAGKRVLDIMNR